MTAPKQNIQSFHLDDTYILYDAGLIEDVSDRSLFQAEMESSSDTEQIQNTAIGRGRAIYFTHQNMSLVLKHYQRGGLIAKLLHDQYFGIKLGNSRSFREWRLLNRCQELGLPSPVPVAARVIRTGLFYRADMIMKEIEHSTTLADLCMASELSADIWKRVGRCIRKFHDKDVYHADLNARNILIDQNSDVFLVDFDKGHFRSMGNSWKTSNLSRLQRSLLKFQSKKPSFHYSDDSWDQLLKGYYE